MRSKAQVESAPMSDAGYSGTPLYKKLEIKPNTRVATVGAPADFLAMLGPLPPGATVRKGLAAPRDLTIWFVTARRTLEHGILKALPPKGTSLWLAWPKKASGIRTDITENVLRDVVLPHGLVDRKVCAIDSTWSGLLFSWRKSAPTLLTTG
jgi:hypothetical protein